MVELVAIKKGFMDGQQYTNILENLHFKIDQGESVAYVTQKFHLLDDRNVFNNIALPLQYLKVPKREIKNNEIKK